MSRTTDVESVGGRRVEQWAAASLDVRLRIRQEKTKEMAYIELGGRAWAPSSVVEAQQIELLGSAPGGWTECQRMNSGE